MKTNTIINAVDVEKVEAVEIIEAVEAVDKMELLENILIDFNNINDTMSIIQQINIQNGDLEFLLFYENDEYFFNEHFYKNTWDAVKAVTWGDYKVSDDYVRYMSDGNLESMSIYDIHEEIKQYITEIIDALLNIWYKLTLDYEIKELIEAIEEDQE